MNTNLLFKLLFAAFGIITLFVMAGLAAQGQSVAKEAGWLLADYWAYCYFGLKFELDEEAELEEVEE